MGGASTCYRSFQRDMTKPESIPQPFQELLGRKKDIIKYTEMSITLQVVFQSMFSHYSFALLYVDEGT